MRTRLEDACMVVDSGLSTRALNCIGFYCYTELHVQLEDLSMQRLAVVLADKERLKHIQGCGDKVADEIWRKLQRYRYKKVMGDVV